MRDKTLDRDLCLRTVREFPGITVREFCKITGLSANSANYALSSVPEVYEDDDGRLYVLEAKHENLYCR